MARQAGMLLRRNLRYLLVGATCAAINNVLLVGLVRAGLSVTTANAAALAPMILVGYGLHVAFTFGVEPSLAGFARFAAGLVAALPLSMAILFVLVDLLHIGIVLAAPTATVLIVAWTYAATHLALRAPLHR